MVTYCQDSPKLCVGTKTGVLALYDLKTPKYQVGRRPASSHHSLSHFGLQPFQAHPKNELITCIEFSPDGKYLASYSAYEGLLYFWQVGPSTCTLPSDVFDRVHLDIVECLLRLVEYDPSRLETRGPTARSIDSIAHEESRLELDRSDDCSYVLACRQERKEVHRIEEQTRMTSDDKQQ